MADLGFCDEGPHRVRRSLKGFSPLARGSPPARSREEPRKLEGNHFLAFWLLQLAFTGSWHFYIPAAYTRSPAVAKIRSFIYFICKEVARCFVSVVSFNSTIPRVQSFIISYFGFRFIGAYDKFWSVVLDVTYRISVINKIRWCVAQRRLLIAGDGRRRSAITYTPPSKCWQHATVQQWSMPKPVLVENRDFWAH